MIKHLTAALCTAALMASTVAAKSSHAPSSKFLRAGPHHIRKSAEQTNLRKAAEMQGYKKVSSLAVFPEFVPGLGVFYVKPETLPRGPLLLFDRKDRLVATVYMIPVEDIDSRKKLDIPGFRGKADHITLYFQSGHVGAEMPHYHLVIWNVSKEGEARVAK